MIRNPQTFNRYSYVLNSPYKFVDPLGLIVDGLGCRRGCGADRSIYPVEQQTQQLTNLGPHSNTGSRSPEQAPQREHTNTEEPTAEQLAALNAALEHATPDDNIPGRIVLEPDPGGLKRVDTVETDSNGNPVVSSTFTASFTAKIIEVDGNIRTGYKYNLTLEQPTTDNFSGGKGIAVGDNGVIDLGPFEVITAQTRDGNPQFLGDIDWKVIGIITVYGATKYTNTKVATITFKATVKGENGAPWSYPLKINWITQDIHTHPPKREANPVYMPR
jgi:hypothetical protein